MLAVALVAACIRTAPGPAVGYDGWAETLLSAEQRLRLTH
jgi:hypothetical protein